MNYLRAENLSKRFGERILFEGISYTLAKGNRVALIAKNGTGKTSLLNLLTQCDEPDEGSVVIDRHIKWAYLEQEPQFDPKENVWEAVFNSDNEILKAVAEYEICIEELEQNPDDVSWQNRLQNAMEMMDNMQAWDIEARVHTILTQLNLQHHLNHTADQLSGGQKKRLALARVLIQSPDMLILDEPTNHLDIQMIEWLEAYLKSQDITLLLVTHDRYFLDTICTEIIELDLGQLFVYKGNYAYFLEKKQLRETYQAKEADQARKLARKELEWMRRQPKARTTKSKSRIDAYYETKEKASFRKDDSQVEIQMQMKRMGSKILEVHQLAKSFGALKIAEDFTYLFKPGERIGVIGKNGVGKSTFLNLLQGLEKPDFGRVVKGETIKFGYYGQQGLQIKEDKRVVEVITDIAEYLEVGKGVKLTAIALLRMFLFDAKKQHNYVSALSGGEKRRLYLLTILMQKPNFLILDEPTNDLDIETLNVLEEFLEGFEGCLLVVTHDRYFMDNLVDKLFVFEGEGYIRDFNGNYQDYLNEVEEKKQEAYLAKQELNKPKIAPKIEAPKPVEKRKLSFKEQRELEQLETEMAELNERKTSLETLLLQGGSNHEELTKWSLEIERIKFNLDEKELRWLELTE
ncbi:MAG: ABC-F family ATP-binding cassette domain-containing protein [Bacteroidia bacterium]|nr:ABC-F family ATP-binding cassette domain-containing protein [Bacteroidia bacterium]MCF8447198.1 ABC-F family ATP-binding cassette domain-containing protein [Bacteroidia bacterium]